MWIRTSVLFDQHPYSGNCLLRHNLGRLQQGVQNSLQTLRQVWKEGLRGAVGQGLEQSQSTRFGFVRLSLHDPRQQGIVEASWQKVSASQQHLRQPVRCTSALHFRNFIVPFPALQLLQQVRHQFLVAQRGQTCGQVPKGFRSLALNANGRMHETFLQERHQLLQVRFQELRLGNQVHGRTHYLGTLHLRLMGLLPHCSRHYREDQPERARVHSVHERGVSHALQSMCCLLHVGTVQNGGNNVARHATDLLVCGNVLAHVNQELFSLLTYILAGVTRSIPERRHYLGHLQPKLFRASFRPTEIVQHVLHNIHDADLDLPLACCCRADVRKKDWKHQLSCRFSSRASLAHFHT
mmetsp:Transcript_50449/g.134115  ORF Transcript_50449/g.134115 Transcript_50449/m.134115 type:complete len:352 (-) Transcript_50449:859-1914(-)